MRVRFSLLLAFGLVGAGLLAPWASEPGAAAVQACALEDVGDASNDVSADPANVNAATGFDQLDIRNLCVAETEKTVHLVLTVGADVQTNNAQDFEWVVTFDLGTTSKAFALQSTAAANTFNPAGSGEVGGAKIQFNLPKTTYSPGSNLSGFAISAMGTFVPQSGDTVTGTDRAPDQANAVAAFSYIVGARAPAGLDSDGDGVPDADEVKSKTHPGKPDTDDDGLLDGVDLQVAATDARHRNFTNLGVFNKGGGLFAGENTARTDPLNPDTDGDALIDGGNLTMAATADRAGNLTRHVAPVPLPGGLVKFVGELSVGTSPTTLDSDGDGLIDGNEVQGSNNRAYDRYQYFLEHAGSTNPADNDTDNDGLLDGQEVAGTGTIAGARRDFHPSNPNVADTDGDGLTDYQEVVGQVVTASGKVETFAPTDPTDEDSDDDGFSDHQEVVGDSNPEDPGDQPGVGPGGAQGQLTYFLLSALALLAVTLLSVAGILWRWG